MAFTEAERVKIRSYLGYSRLFSQLNTRLESAMNAVQSTVDGGSYPTSDTETAIRAWLADLDTIEEKLRCTWPQMAALTVDELEVDPARAVAALRMEGRRLVARIADALSITPGRDAFSSRQPEFG